jgi:large subunit ribosomal protein L1
LEREKLAPNKAAFLKTVKELKEKTTKRNFTQSIELSFKLKELDLKRPENRINEAIELPHQINKPVKICVIASGDLVLRAKKAEADKVLEKSELDALVENKKAAKKLVNDHDHFIAEASLMPTTGRILGPFLGPRSKMPTPVPPNVDIKSVIDRHRKTVRIRVREQPSVKCRIGTEDMNDEQLAENVLEVIPAIEAKLPKGSRNIENIRLKATMGPSMKVIE